MLKTFVTFVQCETNTEKMNIILGNPDWENKLGLASDPWGSWVKADPAVANKVRIRLSRK